MFVYLSKLLPPLVYPLGLAILFLVLALILARRPRLRTAALVISTVVLLAASNRWVASSLARSLEWRYLPASDIPNADVIVLLGGGTDSADPPRPMVEVNGAGDRVFYAAYLYRQGKAPAILASGGNLSFAGQQPSTPAEDMAKLLNFMDVPASAIWLEDKSQNTYENAL